MDKKKILHDSLNNLRKDVEKTFTKEDILKKTFLNRLEQASPEPSVIDVFKEQWKSLSTIFVTIFSIGFILARITMPLNYATKGVDDNDYLDELSSESILIDSKKDFVFLINEAYKLDLDISIERMGSYKQLFIQSLVADDHSTIKEKLDLDPTYQGPITIVIKND